MISKDLKFFSIFLLVGSKASCMQKIWRQTNQTIYKISQLSLKKKWAHINCINYNKPIIKLCNTFKPVQQLQYWDHVLFFKVPTPTELKPSKSCSSFCWMYVCISCKKSILIGCYKSCNIRIIETLICLESSHWLKLDDIIELSQGQLLQQV